MSTRVLTPPGAEPISQIEAQGHINLTEPTALEQADLTLKLQGACNRAERYLHRALITQRLMLTLDGWAEVIRLPRPPLQQVEAVQYLDPDGAEQTLATDQYQVDTADEPARLAPAPGCTWPLLQAGALGSVRVTYLAGFGATNEDVPPEIRVGILVLLGDLYEHREDVVVGTVASDVEQVSWQALLAPYVVHDWAM